MLGKLDDELAILLSNKCYLKDAKIRNFIIAALSFYIQLLKHCQSKKYFLSVDVSMLTIV